MERKTLIVEAGSRLEALEEVERFSGWDALQGDKVLSNPRPVTWPGTRFKKSTNKWFEVDVLLHVPTTPPEEEQSVADDDSVDLRDDFIDP